MSGSENKPINLATICSKLFYIYQSPSLNTVYPFQKISGIIKTLMEGFQKENCFTQKKEYKIFLILSLQDTQIRPAASRWAFEQAAGQEQSNHPYVEDFEYMIKLRQRNWNVLLDQKKTRSTNDLKRHNYAGFNGCYSRQREKIPSLPLAWHIVGALLYEHKPAEQLALSSALCERGSCVHIGLSTFVSWPRGTPSVIIFVTSTLMNCILSGVNLYHTVGSRTLLTEPSTMKVGPLPSRTLAATWSFRYQQT